MTSFLATVILMAIFTLAIGVVGWIVAGAAAELKEQKQLEAKRRIAEATRIVWESAPELSTLRKAVTILRDYVADANRYRPSLSSPFCCAAVAKVATKSSHRGSEKRTRAMSSSVWLS